MTREQTLVGCCPSASYTWTGAGGHVACTRTGGVCTYHTRASERGRASSTGRARSIHMAGQGGLAAYTWLGRAGTQHTHGRTGWARSIHMAGQGGHAGQGEVLAAYTGGPAYRSGIALQDNINMVTIHTSTQPFKHKSTTNLT